MKESNSSQKSIQLQRNLLYSHLSIAALGVFILIIGGSSTLWLRGYAVDLATVSGPKTVAVNRLQIGIQQSLANLRGWMAFNNTDFSINRQQAWRSEIYPSLKALVSLEEDKEHSRQLLKLDNKLRDLEMWQWHIEDVAQTPGNQPAEVMLSQTIKPLANQMFAATAAMIEIEVQNSIKSNKIEILNSLVELRTHLYQTSRHINWYVEQGREIDKSAFKRKIQRFDKQLKWLSEQSFLSRQQTEQFGILQNSYNAYEQLAKELILIRNRDDWNVANYLLLGNAIPLVKEISTQLIVLSEKERQKTQGVVSLIERISTLIPWLMGVLLISMLTLAYRMAKKGSRQFIGPVIELERQDHIKSELAYLAQQIQGTQNHQELSEKIILDLATQTNAFSGIFYLVQEQNNLLRRMATYAVPDNVGLEQIALGKGLVGQAWANKKTIEIKPKKGHELTIQTSLLEVVPESLLIIPIQYEDEVKALVELALLQPLTDYQKEYLDMCNSQIGRSLYMMEQQLIIQKALEDSETKTSRLQSQQMKLHVTNEELNLKSNELQTQQEELRSSNEELTAKGEALEIQTRELEVAKLQAVRKSEELEEASRYKSEFLANMSHELRTPLNSVLILAKLLAENQEGNLNEDEVESSQIIHESGSNLLNLINDILDISKIEAGHMEVHNGLLILNDLSDYLTKHFKHVAEENSLSFHTEIAEDTPAETVTDSIKLNQILINLIGNALKFTHEGGVTVNISSCSSESIFPDTVGQLITFAISDTGVGIPAENQDHIFDAFKQADGSTSRSYGGTGLGLSISVNLAGLLGGDIRLQSIEGEGSTFTLYIPHKHSLEETKETTAPRLAPMETQEKAENRNIAPPFEDDRNALDEQKSLILIIEDDDKFSKILFDVCHKKGSQALVAPNGETGVTLAKKYLPKGIILDIKLPGMDGREVLHQLKTLAETVNIPVHVVSALDDITDLKALGAIDALTKPVSPKQVKDVLDKLNESGLTDLSNVLLVEDDPASLKATDKLLSRLGVKCHQVSTVDAALQALSEHSFGLLILDLGLPGMDGFQLLQQIKNDETLSIPHVIVYTGKDLTDEENDSLQAFTEKIIIKSAQSPERLTDEVSLFLHSLHQPEHKQHDSDENQISFDHIKALVVDDDMRNTFALSKVLRKKGMKVLLAPSGEKALELLDENDDINLVLMDIMMPGMDGYEATAAIRTRPECKDLPVIALTAKAMPGDKEKCIAAGASDYLTKPIDIDKLFNIIQLWTKAD